MIDKRYGTRLYVIVCFFRMKKKELNNIKVQKEKEKRKKEENMLRK